jgi:pyruvate/2-oxoglutarate dehydrogenase complex dihydrolipoamide dehydrogenase (E3) component
MASHVFLESLPLTPCPKSYSPIRRSPGSDSPQSKQKAKVSKFAKSALRWPALVHFCTEDYDGWAQWVVEDVTGRIVGATFVGREVADLLHPSTVAVTNSLSWMQMFHAVPSFPTVSEVYHNLVEACAASEKN